MSANILGYVKHLLSAQAFRYRNEDELQQAIALVLTDAEVSFEREKRLNKRDRVDFLVDDGLVIEVKVGGSGADLTRQLFRYAEQTEVLAILVVTSMLRLRAPTDILGKPCRTLWIGAAL